MRRLLLFGYQGKLIKLAGGIFHTHHHLADGRAEVLTALAALEGLPHAQLRRLHAAATVEAALADLAAADPGAAERLRRRIAAEVEQRSAAYLARYGQQAMAVGAALFNRSRGLAALGPLGSELWGPSAPRPRSGPRSRVHPLFRWPLQPPAPPAAPPARPFGPGPFGSLPPGSPAALPLVLAQSFGARAPIPRPASIPHVQRQPHRHR